MIAFYLYILVWLFTLQGDHGKITSNSVTYDNHISLVILGTLQDGGSPHAACTRACCKDLFSHPDPQRQVVSLGLYDSENNKRYLFEATPDLPRQVKALINFGATTDREMPDGIFLTHAHIGHYAGLMFLGKEAADTKEVKVFAMPAMAAYLQSNGPWSQLVERKNIVINPLKHEQPVKLSPSITVTPIRVPHRDEFSETVGYRINGPAKKVLFIPDIDKWEKWDKSIVTEIGQVDYAFIDATFYNGKELNNRDMSQVPHPTVEESMRLFSNLPASEKNKIIFIHFNHTNPLLVNESPETKQVLHNGFRIGRIGEVFRLD